MPDHRHAQDEIALHRMIRNAWVGVFAVCTTAFVSLLVLVESGASRGSDRQILLDVHQTFGRSAYGMFEAVTHLGDTAVQVVLALIVVLLLAAMRRWQSGVLLLCVLLGASALDLIAKSLVARARPQVFPHVVSAGGFSFPSGHATNSSAMFLTVAYLVWNLTGRRDLTAAAVTIALLVVTLVGLSRLVLGVHYATDVVAGYMLSGAWISVSVLLLHRYLARER